MNPLHVKTWVAATIAIVCIAGCGETYIDESASSTTVSEIAATTEAPVPADATVPVLMEMLSTELSTLSQAVIDQDDLGRRSARIDEIWDVLEPQLDGTTVTNTANVVELAQRAITSRRPADADKAYRLLTVIDAP